VNRMIDAKGRTLEGAQNYWFMVLIMVQRVTCLG